MVSVKTPRKPAKWYAPTKAAFVRLEALGAPRKDIFEGWIPAQHWTKVKMRPGETLGVVDGYRAFGTGKKEITRAVDRFHEQKAVIVDVETNKNSMANGHILFAAATASRRFTAAEKEARATERADAKRKENGAMVTRDAYTEWHKKDGRSADEKAEYIGWPRSSLYAEFGPIGAPAGRRPKQQAEA